MSDSLKKILESGQIEASVPCRIDMGGTLDISTFNLPLHHLAPCTFNIALDLKTRVRLSPYIKGQIKISSRGFESAVFALDEAPFAHPLGLMFAIAAYFRAEGVHVEITSSSPPRSALGGSSAAAVALIAALGRAYEKAGRQTLTTRQVVRLAYAIESSVAGVPCGMQDQLAAAYGGVNAWHWNGQTREMPYQRKLVVPKRGHRALEKCFLAAYCGVPHASKDINGRWVAQFLAGEHRALWADIVGHTRRFIAAITRGNYGEAAGAMNREVALRRVMTPDVFDKVGEELVDGALACGCGARFTGAGGGGCIWALGTAENIAVLRDRWQRTLSAHPEAALLDAGIDATGLRVEELTGTW